MEISDPKKRNRILALLFFGVLMGALDIAIVGPALPAIKQSFSVTSDRATTWVFSIYVLFNLIGTPLMSKLSDTFGRKTIYIIDITIFAVGSLIVALAPHFWFVLLGRGIQGFGAGGIFPVASAVIGDTFPPEKRGRALGMIGAVFGVAFILGPVLAGVLLLASWHWLFIINLPIAVTLIILSFKILPESDIKDTGKFDWFGMIVLGVLLGLLAYGINEIDTNNFFSSLISVKIYPFLLGAIVLIPIFIWIESRASNPIIPLSFFKKREIVLAYLVSVGAGFSESGLVFIPALTLAANMVKTKTQSSFLLLPVVVAMAIASPFIGRLLDKLGSKVVIISGSIIGTVGFITLGLSKTHLALFIVSEVLIGLGLSALIGAPVRFIVLNETEADDRSIAQGLASLFTRFGQLIGSAIVSAVIASSANLVTGHDHGYLLISGVTFILIFTSLALKNHREEEAMIEKQENPLES